MIIKTKKYKLPTKTFVRIGYRAVLRQQWWAFAIYVALMCGYFLAPNIWWFIGPTILLGIFLLFWRIQFAGITQLDQGKMLFERMSYEISSKEILMKLNPRQGMPIKWEQVRRVQVRADAFVLFLSKVQFIYLPHKVFNHDNEIRFMESILKRKGFIKE